MEIPLQLYRYLLRISIVIVLYGGLNYYFLETTNQLFKIITIWVILFLIINIINIDVTLGHYIKNSTRKGYKGVTGRGGMKGFVGSKDVCHGGSYTVLANKTDKDGNEDNNPNLKIGKCLFPFVYKWKYQNKCIVPKECNIETDPHCVEGYTKEEGLTLPTGFKEGGICATQVDSDRNPIKYGYCHSSEELKRTSEKLDKEKMDDLVFNKTNQGILDIKLIHGKRSTIKCPDGYTKINKDLNEGSSGSYIYACKKEGIGSFGVNAIGIAKNIETCEDIFPRSNPEDPIGRFRKLPIDLNQGTRMDGWNPTKMYMCLNIKDKDFITDIEINNDNTWQKDGYSNVKITGSTDEAIDLNEGTDGKPLYMYTSNNKLDTNPVDTAFFYDKELYFFMNGTSYYTFNKGKVSEVKTINSKFGDIPDTMTAGFVWGFDKELYLFNNQYVYKYDKRNYKIMAGFPKAITSVFKGIPSNIDAVFTWDKDNSTYFFKDKYVYKVYNKNSEKFARLSAGYPRLIQKRFPGAPDNPNAVYYDKNDGETYFVRGNQYWVLGSDEGVKSGYPKLLSELYSGLGTRPKTHSFYTALNLGNTIFFFEGNNVHYYSPKEQKLVQTTLEKSSFRLLTNFPNFDCGFYNSVTRNHSIFDGKAVHILNINNNIIDTKLISEEFPGLPNDIDGVFLSKGIVYAFKGYYFYKFNLNSKSIEEKLIKEEIPEMPINMDGFVIIDNTIYMIKGIEYFTITDSLGGITVSKARFLDSMPMTPFKSTDSTGKYVPWIKVRV
jgi:hypothetical protein